MNREEKSFKRICKNCGLTWGSHSSSPCNQCPGHEGLADWSESPGTCFEYSGMRDDTIPRGTPARRPGQRKGRMLRLK